MADISISQTKNGYCVGDRVKANGMLSTLTLVKLVLNESCWITAVTDPNPDDAYHGMVDDYYIKHWKIDPKYRNLRRKDINSDDIIGFAIKKRCLVCHQR